MDDPSPLENRAPGRGRYAHPEVEGRFLARGALPAADRIMTIEDLYLDGLRLRLRAMRADDAVVFKLTQKIRVDERDPSHVQITNIYLSEAEHARLRSLPGRRLTKTRRRCGFAGTVFAVDEFRGPLEGLVLVEVEVDDPARPITLPPWAGREVTGDDRFSGGRLAALDDPDELRRMLADT